MKKFLDGKPDFKSAVELITSLIKQTNYSDAMIEIEDNLHEEISYKFLSIRTFEVKRSVFT